jgi:hypothetical protein
MMLVRARRPREAADRLKPVPPARGSNRRRRTRVKLFLEIADDELTPFGCKPP